MVFSIINQKGNNFSHNLIFNDDYDSDVESFLMYHGDPLADATRSPRYFYDLTKMESHFKMCREVGGSAGYTSRYHMREEYFMHLVDILRKDLQIFELQSARGSSNNENITPEIIVCCGLRFMGGEKIKSLIDIYGFSQSKGYKLVDKFFVALAFLFIEFSVFISFL